VEFEILDFKIEFEWSLSCKLSSFAHPWWHHITHGISKLMYTTKTQR